MGKIQGPQFELGLSLVSPLLCSLAIVAQDSNPKGSFVLDSREFCFTAISMAVPPGHVHGLDFAIVTSRMPRGLPRRPFENGGNSCYINAALQLLAIAQSFVTMVLGHLCAATCFL